MPRRRVDRLQGIRVELNQTERDLLETQIWVGGISKTVQGLGVAAAGASLGLGIVAAAFVFEKEIDDVVNWVKDKADLGKQEWEEEHLSTAEYNAFFDKEWAERENRWLDMKMRTGQDVSFQDYEAANYDQPIWTYEDWSAHKRQVETVKRRGLIGAVFPVYHVIGIADKGLKNWLSGFN